MAVGDTAPVTDSVGVAVMDGDEVEEYELLSVPVRDGVVLKVADRLVDGDRERERDADCVADSEMLAVRLREMVGVMEAEGDMDVDPVIDAVDVREGEPVIVAVAVYEGEPVSDGDGEYEREPVRDVEPLSDTEPE